MQQEIKDFGELVKKGYEIKHNIKKKKINQMLDKPLIITKAFIGKSKYEKGSGLLAKIYCKDGEEECYFNTGSGLIIQQLREVYCGFNDKMPNDENYFSITKKFSCVIKCSEKCFYKIYSMKGENQ